MAEKCWTSKRSSLIMFSEDYHLPPAIGWLLLGMCKLRVKRWDIPRMLDWGLNQWRYVQLHSLVSLTVAATQVCSWSKTTKTSQSTDF